MTDDQAHEQLTDQLLLANAEIAKWRAMLKSEAWQEFRAVIEEQIALRRDNYETTPGQGLDALVELNFQRGEIAALRFVIEQPERSLAALEDTAAGLRELRESTTDEDDPDG